VVSTDPNYHYRVYARQMIDEESFQIRFMQSKHVCGRKYKNSIVNPTWIADKLKVQPNMPLDVILDEVNDM
jgi:hypothetical protein